MKKIFNLPFLPAFTALPYFILAVFLAFTDASLYPLALITGLSALGFVIYYMYRRQLSLLDKKDFWHIILFCAFISVIGFLYFYNSSAPGEGVLLFYLTLSSIPPLYAMMGVGFHTVYHSQKQQNIAHYILSLVGLPFLFFAAGSLFSSVNAESFTMILVVGAYYTFIFLLIHIVFLAKRQFGSGGDELEPESKNHYITTFCIGIFMPVTGLILNAGIVGASSGGLFGDFSSPWFYIIAAFNGGLLMFPRPKDMRLRLLLFYLRAAGYTYILYFFVVFLPILPIGFLGLMILLGIYVFAPAAVTVLQGRVLYRDFKILKNHFNIWIIFAVFTAGLLTIPACMYISIQGDGENLRSALPYISDTKANREVDLSRLNRTLAVIQSGYDFTTDRFDLFDTGFGSGNIPILTNLYATRVLENKSLTQENIAKLKHIFFDETNGEDRWTGNPDLPTEVVLREASSKTAFDSSIGAYRTWIDLTLQNTTDFRNAEYAVRFDLPEGTYVSNYYLDVFGEKKFGLLTDRRAALFIYNQIVRRAQDPGILHYIGENRLELRVFPFAAGEQRTTGFELIHLEKFDLKLSNTVIPIDGDNGFEDLNVEGALLLSAEKIASLPRVSREPQYHFVIDCSQNSDGDWLMEQVREYCLRNHILSASVYFTSYKVLKSTLDDMETDRQKAGNKGGFNFNLAARIILEEVEAGKYPVIIAVTDNMPMAVLPNVSNLAGLYPEMPYYYSLNHRLTLTPYLFESNERQSETSEFSAPDVVSYNGHYLVNDGRNKLVLTEDTGGSMTGMLYRDAILLRAEYMRNALRGNLNDVQHIRNSFRTGILSNQTAYIVVETLEQERDLLTMQEKLLNQDSESANTPVQSLNEPSIVILGILCLGVMLYKSKSK